MRVVLTMPCTTIHNLREWFSLFKHVQWPKRLWQRLLPCIRLVLQLIPAFRILWVIFSILSKAVVDDLGGQHRHLLRLDVVRVPGPGDVHLPAARPYRGRFPRGQRHHDLLPKISPKGRALQGPIANVSAVVGEERGAAAQMSLMICLVAHHLVHSKNDGGYGQHIVQRS